jgi:hypothetical protein
MSTEKTYKLLKDLPQCEAGTEFVKYADDAVDYVAKNVMVYSSGDCKRHEFFLDDKLVEDNPDWFKELTPEAENIIPDVEKFVESISERQIELFEYYVKKRLEKKYPENKTTDSFWTDELVLEFANGLRDAREIMAKWHWHKQSVLDFKKAKLKQSHTPKPQADNKPDWEIVALKEESGNIYKKPVYPPPYWDSIIEHIKNKSTLKKIHSVQRSSDNSVFSVDENTGIGVIKEFKILDGKMKAKGDYGFVDLMLVHKLPPQPQKEEQRSYSLDEINKKLGLYTQAEVDAMCEDVWYAARAKVRPDHGIELYKYEDLDHYKSKQIKSPK